MTTELTSDGVALETVAEGFYTPRDLTYIRPQKRRLSEYEAVICNAQPDMGQFDTGGWYLLRRDGLGTQDARTTVMVHPNWFEYRDPSALWQRPYIKLQAQHERSIQRAIDSAKLNGAFQISRPAGWSCCLATTRRSRRSSGGCSGPTPSSRGKPSRTRCR